MSEKRLSSRDILIQTPDIEHACAFYEDTLGLTAFLRRPNLIGLEAGAFRLFLERGPAYGPVFEFFADNIEQTKEELLNRGCRIEAEDDSIPKCYLRDPYGLTFNLSKR